MIIFILNLIIVGSIGFILYLFARALPRVDDTDTSISESPTIHWFIEQLERIDEILLSSFEKFLRRFRVLLLKLDNTVSQKLRRFQKGGVKENSFVEESKVEEREKEKISA